RRRRRRHREHRAPPPARRRGRPPRRPPRRRARAHLARHDVDHHHGSGVPPPRPAPGGGGAVLRRARDHPHRGGARLAAPRAHADPAPRRAVRHGARRGSGRPAATPEVTGTARRTGAELGMFATAQNRGDIVVRLAPRNRRARDVFAVIDDVRDRIQGAVPRLHIEFMQILADVINDLAGAARPVEVKLYGERLDTLEAYARRLAPALEHITGLQDLYNGVSEPTAELLMRVNQAVADRIGM